MHNPAGITARLDSQDVIFSKPLREYLTSQGTRVVENHPASISTHYHIICGDKNFVKRILEAHGQSSYRVLVISRDPSTKTNAKIGVPHVKLVLVDAGILDDDRVVKIFNFFITGSMPILDLRTQPAGSEKKITLSDKERIDRLIEDVFEKKKSDNRASPLRRISWKTVLVFFLILPIFWYCMSLGASTLAYMISSKALLAGDSGASRKSAQVGVGLARAGKVLVSLGPLIGQERLFSFLLDSGSSLIRFGNIVSEAQDLGRLLVSKEQNTGQPHPVVVLDRLRTEVASLTVDVGLLQAEAKRLIGEGIFPLSMVTAMGMEDRVRGRFEQAHRLLSDVDGILSLYRQAGGFSKTQTYLLLLQNSMELRPTGGFIGSVGRVTMSDGTISDFSILDVYELDGQLRGHVDPPEPIRTLLGQEHWYLRDSNWDPDFAVSAERAAWFYEKESGSAVDGVIGLTSALIPKLLAATGPIDLTDYNDQITAENFYGKALFYTKEDFFPGSTQKKDFLGSLTRNMFARLESGSSVNSSALLDSLIKGLSYRDIQLFFADPSVQRIAQAYGWAGRMTTLESGELPVAVVDSNLGVNKANFFVTGEIDRDIELESKGNLRETLTVSQDNGAGEQSAQDPVYKSYMRIYLSPEAEVDSVTINASPLPRIDRLDVQSELPFWQQSREHERVVVSVAGVLGPGKSRRIVVRYTIAEVIVSDSSLTLTTRAQAGVPEMPLTISIRAPGDRLMTLTDGEVVASAGQLRYNTTLAADQMARITFSK